jgi:hypothetical protein
MSNLRMEKVERKIRKNEFMDIVKNAGLGEDKQEEFLMKLKDSLSN